MLLTVCITEGQIAVILFLLITIIFHRNLERKFRYNDFQQKSYQIHVLQMKQDFSQKFFNLGYVVCVKAELYYTLYY